MLLSPGLNPFVVVIVRVHGLGVFAERFSVWVVSIRGMNIGSPVDGRRWSGRPALHAPRISSVIAEALALLALAQCPLSPVLEMIPNQALSDES